MKIYLLFAALIFTLISTNAVDVIITYAEPVNLVIEWNGTFPPDTTRNLNHKNKFYFKCNNAVYIYKDWVCDGQKDCDMGEDEENCDDYLHQFDDYEQWKPSGEPQQTWRMLSVEGCARKCSEAAEFNCASFGFKPETTSEASFCTLSNHNRESGLVLRTNRHFNYYERIEDENKPDCNFTCDNGGCVVCKDCLCNDVEECFDGSDEKNCDEPTNAVTVSPCPSLADCSKQCPDGFAMDINSCYECRCKDVAELVDHRFAVRLANGSTPSEGRVEVSVNGSWGVVCNDEWNLINADVVCTELGYPRGALEIKRKGHYGDGNGKYFMDNVKCIGNESSIAQCPFNGWEIHNCGKGETAGVVCDVLAEGTIRLRGGSDHLSGRVEVHKDGVWGSICHYNWDSADAQVACRSLGFHGPAKDGFGISFGVGSGPIFYDEVHCFGLENGLDECEKSTRISHYCTNKKIAGVICSEGDEVTEVPSVVKGILPDDCGKRTKTDTPSPLTWTGARIMGGMESEYGAHPWIIGVRKKERFGSNHHCGGTIISEFFAVSAAHCFKDTTLSLYEIVAGDFNNRRVDGWEQKFRVDRLIIHEGYNKDLTQDNDIALVKIKRNRRGNGFKFNTYIQPACLPSPNTQYPSGKNCIISGWGSTGSYSVSILQSAKVPILSRATCCDSKAYKYARLTAGMFCAGVMEGGVDSCKGDSGGPFVCEESDHFTLFGVVSWGEGCGKPNKPGIYVTVRQYLGWIYEKLIEDSKAK